MTRDQDPTAVNISLCTLALRGAVKCSDRFACRRPDIAAALGLIDLVTLSKQPTETSDRLIDLFEKLNAAAIVLTN